MTTQYIKKIVIPLIVGTLAVASCEKPNKSVDRISPAKGNPKVEEEKEKRIEAEKKAKEAEARAAEEEKKRIEAETKVKEEEKKRKEEEEKRKDVEEKRAELGKDFVKYCNAADLSEEEKRTIEIIKNKLLGDDQKTCEDILAKVKTLDILKLSNTKESDYVSKNRKSKIKNIKPLKYFTWLRAIDLNYHDVRSIEELSKMEDLQSLWISYNPNFTIKSIDHIPPNLKDLLVLGTMVADDIVRTNLKVIRE